MRFYSIGEDVWACVQPDRGFGWSNAAFVNRGGGLLIDTFFDLKHTRDLLDECVSVADRMPARAINTHHNGDHTWGNQLLTGSEIIGTERCAEAMKTDQTLQMIRAAAAGDPEELSPGARKLMEDVKDFDFTGVEITPPNRTFTGELELNLDGLECRIIEVGPAHSPGDAVVWLPELKILIAGDIVFNKCTPVGWAGTFNNWDNALELIQSLSPRVVVPGHGPVCTWQDVAELREYFKLVRSESGRHFDSGSSVLEACKQIELGRFRAWTQPERLVFNVNRAYRELQGTPWDEPVDVVGLPDDMVKLREYWDT
jgi:glyoxylase-like metal-dependent hydrolase (beta-lactamase superfamily II)